MSTAPTDINDVELNVEDPLGWWIFACVLVDGQETDSRRTADGQRTDQRQIQASSVNGVSSFRPVQPAQKPRSSTRGLAKGCQGSAG
ncbi:hypothetical protein ANO14919_004920 [Xylariales sp. No.14919]|nr:hypothetical protein ANO14919_004920 [Xylariales sp. No.14919]